MDAPCPTATRIVTATIELQAIFQERGELFAAITDGTSSWMMPVRSCDLTTFPIFQCAVVRRRGIWIDHPCQDERDWHERSRAWHLAVAKAFERGAR